MGTPEESTSLDQFSSQEALQPRLLELMRGQFGGESKIISQDHNILRTEYQYQWRFIPPVALPLPHKTPPAASNPSPLNSSMFLMENDRPTKPTAASQKYPFRNKEEYEAFFRRAV